MQLLSERFLLAIVDLVAICLLLYLSSRSRIVPCLIPSCMSTCVIFTCSWTSHMTYHVISFDPSTNYVTSHVINPDTQLLTPTFPLWFADTLTRLGQLPNQIARLLSYLGITPVRNSRTWMTKRHSDLTVTLEQASSKPEWLQLPETRKEKANLRIGIFIIYPNPTTLPLKHWEISNAHSTQSLNPKTAYLLNSLKMYDIYSEVKIPEHPIQATMPGSTMHWYLSVMSMAYGLKYMSKRISLNAFD